MFGAHDRGTRGRTPARTEHRHVRPSRSTLPHDARSDDPPTPIRLGARPGPPTRRRPAGTAGAGSVAASAARADTAVDSAFGPSPTVRPRPCPHRRDRRRRAAPPPDPASRSADREPPRRWPSWPRLVAVSLAASGFAVAQASSTNDDDRAHHGRATRTPTTATVKPTTVATNGGATEPVAAVAAALAPSVVQIETTQGLGSGVHLRQRRATSSPPRTSSPAPATPSPSASPTARPRTGTVVGADTSTDVAVVKVSLSGTKAQGREPRGRRAAPGRPDRRCDRQPVRPRADRHVGHRRARSTAPMQTTQRRR